MEIKYLIDEDFINYKKSSMFIGFPYCTFKCDKENGGNYCQNWVLSLNPNIECNPSKLVDRYINNPITHAVVFGGLEPMDSYDDILELIRLFREKTDDDIVIYTGYNKEEIKDKVEELSNYTNIIIKFGRFRPNQESHYDKVLGIELKNPEQYAERISKC